MDVAAIGSRLAVIRKRRRLTQGELAGAIGVTEAAISQYERGRTALKATRLVQLARALDCRPGDLLEPVDAPVRRGGHSPRVRWTRLEHTSAVLRLHQRSLDDGDDVGQVSR